jgi:MFS transporter, DHA1 family, multidrug resistance protein
MVATSALFRLLVMHVGPAPLRRVALVTQTGGVVVLFIAVLVAGQHQPSLAVVWASLAAMTAGLGMYFPANTAIAQHAGRRYAGTASALGGGLPYLVGSLTTPLTGVFGSETVMTMAMLMVLFFALAAISAIWLRGAAAQLEEVGTDPVLATEPSMATYPDIGGAGLGSIA